MFFGVALNDFIFYHNINIAPTILAEFWLGLIYISLENKSVGPSQTAR